jgi:hypothetical protein
VLVPHRALAATYSIASDSAVLWGVGDRLGDDVIGALGADERNALGCAEGQVELVYPALAECATVCTDGSDAVIEPACNQLCVGVSPRPLGVGQPDQLGGGVGVAGQ